MEPLPEGALMDRAAAGLAEVVAARLDPEHGSRIVVLAGSGGNGGDALWAAAKLAGRPAVAGVTCVLVASEVHGPGLAAAKAAGCLIVDATDDDQLGHALDAVGEADLVIDGIAGIGGRPGFPGKAYRHHLAALLKAVPPDAYVVAVDLPSGADPAGLTPATLCLRADETVTFGVAKPVHVLVTSPACGLLTVVDIGLEMTTAPSAERLIHDDVAALWPVPGADSDKYSRGVLGVVAGGERYAGAALLTVTAAVCAGAGMVRYVGPPVASALVRSQVPEAVLGTGQVQAWVVGPGLDPDDSEQVAAALDVLAGDAPCVVDAGALELLDAPRPRAGARTLLTPHAGELARLLNRIDPPRAGQSPLDAATVRELPVATAARAAELLHATVLLKGSVTVIVPPPKSGLPVRAQADAPPWLATAGSGDVLAGVAGMLLAAGLDPLEAGSLAALVHGLAGVEANPGGPVRALGVAHALPAVIARLLQRPSLWPDEPDDDLEDEEDV
ncbi:MAG: bifunctional ADP-dependent NAD(P)H-hydrate dehydratase/NAD(P)H-hydrate epimerase [Austwickia sp.]|nr:bifunctional ADP-dependent NAD(P)H-hydrate dehydratase/NAD(P)H-hydrate epimerase [Austwickia sp.]